MLNGLESLALGVLAVMGMCCLAYLFVSLKADLRLLDKRAAQCRDTSEQAIRDLEGVIANLRSELQGMQGVMAPPVQGGLSGFNPGSRTQILQLTRRGKQAQQIARELGVPVSEVELLVKVHNLVLESL